MEEMMEHWEYNPNDENEPRVNLGIGNGEYVEANRGNTRLYTFLGQAACMNHVFITLEQQKGAYIFNFVQGFDQLAAYMMQNDFPAYLNQTEVPQCDVDAYERAIHQLSSDTDHVPEDWS